MLQSGGIETTIRRKLGSSINAACGQLRKKIQKQRGVVMVGVGKSNVGMLRPRNEDSILVSNEL